MWRTGQVLLTPDIFQDKEGRSAALKLEVCFLAVLQWVPEKT